jgi:hypothetical protein
MTKAAILFTLLLAAATSPAFADALKLTGPQIAKALSEKILVSAKADDTSTQLFKANGATFYSSGSTQQQGSWRIKGDQYCSLWPPSETPSCYDVYVTAGTVRFVSSSGNSTDWIVKGP